MCGPAKTRGGNESLSSVEGRKAAGAGFGHWNHAALELRRTRQGVARIPLWGNNSIGSTSKAAGEKREELGAVAERGANWAAGVEVGTARGTAKSQNTRVMKDPRPQIMEQFGDVRRLFENSVLPSP
ncbi:hypothetical protein NDU88_006204 [Pleurodeles waltl]|uniref:Uncharacterized protein n=1 Tax=Pleurodeles waltl TaxID=8319 RepID=A0AAV7MF69_PLEWA|nr:hypothetical protein NDU88_006204 [Pleurodeles waltl]